MAVLKDAIPVVKVNNTKINQISESKTSHSNTSLILALVHYVASSSYME